MVLFVDLYLMPILGFAGVYLVYRYFMKRAALPPMAAPQAFCTTCGTPSTGPPCAVCGPSMGGGSA